MIKMPDPVGSQLAAGNNLVGLILPVFQPHLGLLGLRSRPNVTIDAADCALLQVMPTCGAAVIVANRKSSSHHHEDSLEATALPRDCAQMVPTTDRQAVGAMRCGGRH